jgi:hypothetical protein
MITLSIPDKRKRQLPFPTLVIIYIYEQVDMIATDLIDRLAKEHRFQSVSRF